MALHYETIIKFKKYCPTPVICGTNRLGKTTSARSALSLVGNTKNFYSSVKERFIPRLCSRSTLPPVLDDVKIPKVLADVAMSMFNNGKDGTCVFEKEPRTCPVFTVNWEVLDGLKLNQTYVDLITNLQVCHQG